MCNVCKLKSCKRLAKFFHNFKGNLVQLFLSFNAIWEREGRGVGHPLCDKCFWSMTPLVLLNNTELINYIYFVMCIESQTKEGFIIYKEK